MYIRYYGFQSFSGLASSLNILAFWYFWHFWNLASQDQKKASLRTKAALQDLLFHDAYFESNNAKMPKMPKSKKVKKFERPK